MILADIIAIIHLGYVIFVILGFILQLTKLGFEVVEVPYDAVVPFGGALHCTTLDVYREGICEDYFPKQIPNY